MDRTFTRTASTAPSEAAPLAGGPRRSADGAFVQMNDTPHLVQDQRLLPWRHAGYGAAVDWPRSIDVEVLTPKLSVATLRAGFKPRLHATATDPKI